MLASVRRNRPWAEPGSPLLCRQSVTRQRWRPRMGRL